MEAAEQEGVRFQFLAAPHRIVGERGEVKGVEVVKTRLGEFDSSGRRRPILTDEVRMIRCSSVILAVGEAVDRDFCAASGLSASRRTACSTSTATRWRPAARSSSPAATWSPGRPTFPTPWDTARMRRGISTRASAGGRGSTRSCRSSPTISDRRTPIPAAATEARDLPAAVRRRRPSRRRRRASRPRKPRAKSARCLRCDIREAGVHAVVHH